MIRIRHLSSMLNKLETKKYPGQDGARNKNFKCTKRAIAREWNCTNLLVHSKKCLSQFEKAKRDYYLAPDLVTIIIIIIIIVIIIIIIVIIIIIIDHFVVIVMVIVIVTHKKQRGCARKFVSLKNKGWGPAVLHSLRRKSHSDIRESNGINFPLSLFFFSRSDYTNPAQRWADHNSQYLRKPILYLHSFEMNTRDIFTFFDFKTSNNTLTI